MAGRSNRTKVRDLNDAFRTSFIGGRMMMTAGVSELPEAEKAAVVRKVMTFDAFNPDNDPHGERDFGSFEHAGGKFLWKIDYYDPSLIDGSEDPADPAKTIRVLTIMRAEEY